MDVERLKQIIVDQRAQLEEKFKKEKIIDRDSSEIRKLFSHPNAFIILGIRRCGKSTLSEEIFRNQKFGYVNFDDDRMIKLDASDLNRVLQALYELYGSDLENIVLDEIQEVYGWEKFVSRLRDTKKVIVTGSNSMLLSGELATSLTGRHLDFTLFPFSFKEYLEYKGIKYSGVLTTAEMSKLNSALHRYLIEGGFPEVLKFGESFLKSIYNDIITKDVIKRHKIKNEGDLKEIASFLLSNISKEFSYSSIIKLTEVKHKITISKWVGYLEEAYLFLKLNRFSFKLKEAVFAPKKIYSVDNGLSVYMSPTTSERDGILMENTVAVELFRRKSKIGTNGYDIFYWKDHQQREVDFVLKDGSRITELIQVTYASSRSSIEPREINNLIEASNQLHCNNLSVITWGYEAEEKIKGKRIKFIPLWKWLLHI